MKHKVFAYGNLMRGMPLFSAEDGVTILGEGTIPGTLYFNMYPRVLLGGTSVVHGEVHEMDADVLALFDCLENIKAHATDPFWYKRLTCTVTMATGIVHQGVWVYAPLQAYKTWYVIASGSFRRFMKEEHDE